MDSLLSTSDSWKGNTAEEEEEEEAEEIIGESFSMPT